MGGLYPNFCGFNLTPDLHAGLRDRARELKVTMGELLRRLVDAELRAARQGAAYAIHHVDELGPDPLWSGKDALPR